MKSFTSIITFGRCATLRAVGSPSPFVGGVVIPDQLIIGFPLNVGFLSPQLSLFNDNNILKNEHKCKKRY